MMWPWFPGLPLHGNLRALVAPWQVAKTWGAHLYRGYGIEPTGVGGVLAMGLTVEVCAAGAAEAAQAVLIQKTFKRIRGSPRRGPFYLYVKASVAATTPPSPSHFMVMVTQP
jgi:hypothetical protein